MSVWEGRGGLLLFKEMCLTRCGPVIVNLDHQLDVIKKNQGDQ